MTIKQGNTRHGTVIPITEEEVKRLTEKWGTAIMSITSSGYVEK